MAGIPVKQIAAVQSCESSLFLEAIGGGRVHLELETWEERTRVTVDILEDADYTSSDSCWSNDSRRVKRDC